MLKIENHDKIMGETFCGRFELTNFFENKEFLEFWFRDLNDMNMHNGEWVKISREKKWDAADQKWYYKIDRRDHKMHYVSLDWFADIDNARATFEEVLKELLEL